MAEYLSDHLGRDAFEEGEGCPRAIRGDEAELGWEIITPVLDAWHEGRVPLEYSAGSDGPPERNTRA